MMTAHKEVVQAFIRGDKAKGYSMFTDGKTIYSWGYHFPIAHKISGGYLFNTDSYSSSTEKHKTYVRCDLNGTIIECNTREIRRAVENEGVIVIERAIRPDSMLEGIHILKEVCKANGMKRFPVKMFDDYLQDKLTVDTSKKKNSIVFNVNKLSIKYFDGYCKIKSNKKEVKVFHRYCGNIAQEFSQFTTDVYSRKCLQLISEKFRNDKAVNDYINGVICRRIKPTDEEFKQIREDNQMVDDL